MATEIDGFAVFATMAAHAHLFEDARAEATKAARAAVTKQVKVKTLPLDQLRGIRAALGPDTLALILDRFKEAEIKSLATRLDRNNAAVKAMPATERLRHLLALAHDTDPVAKPTARPARGQKPAATAKAASAERPSPARKSGEPERTLSSEAMAAKSPRRRARAAD